MKQRNKQAGERAQLWRHQIPSEVSRNDEFCIKNENLSIKNEEFCIKNDEFYSTLKNTTSEFMNVVKTRRQNVADQEQRKSQYGASSVKLQSSIFTTVPGGGAAGGEFDIKMTTLQSISVLLGRKSNNSLTDQ